MCRFVADSHFGWLIRPRTGPLHDHPPNLTLSSTTTTMRSLPVELEQMVINQSLVGLGLLKGYQARIVLSLVCRAWREFVKLDKHLVAVGLANVDRARAKLESSGTGHSIRTVYIYIDNEGFEAGMLSVAGLLELVPEARAVHLVGEDDALSEQPWNWNGDHELGEPIIRALTAMTNLAVFNLGRDRGHSCEVTLKSEALAR